MKHHPDQPEDATEPLFPLPTSSDRIEEFARRMAILADLLPKGGAKIPPGEAGAFARQLFEERRIRDAFLGDGALFGEPAWDIMLDLFAAAEEGRPTTASTACTAAAVPASTGLRYLNSMIKLGLLEQYPGDGGELFVTLSPSCRARMSQLLGRMIAARRHPGAIDEEPDRRAPRHG